MAGYRPPYTEDEEYKIVHYIIDNALIHRIKGDQIFKDMEEAKIIDRTWQSVKQHFREKIVFELHLPRYQVDQKTQNDFLFHSGLETAQKEKNKEMYWEFPEYKDSKKLNAICDHITFSSSSDSDN